MFTVLMILLMAERLSELVFSRRNRRWAISRGGIERGQIHYPFMVALHTLFFISIIVEHNYLSRGWNPHWPAWLSLVILSQLLRGWAALSLGRLWNTRIIVIPGTRPVLKGPYRFVRHPNYLAVVVEMFAIPILCGAYITATVFSILNAIALYWRIREEERALDLLGGSALQHLPRLIPDMRKLFHERAGGSRKPG
jgi:methyltransferase